MYEGKTGRDKNILDNMASKTTKPIKPSGKNKNTTGKVDSKTEVKGVTCTSEMEQEIGQICEDLEKIFDSKELSDQTTPKAPDDSLREDLGIIRLLIKRLHKRVENDNDAHKCLFEVRRCVDANDYTGIKTEAGNKSENNKSGDNQDTETSSAQSTKQAILVMVQELSTENKRLKRIEDAVKEMWLVEDTEENRKQTRKQTTAEQTTSLAENKAIIQSVDGEEALHDLKEQFQKQQKSLIRLHGFVTKLRNSVELPSLKVTESSITEDKNESFMNEDSQTKESITIKQSVEMTEDIRRQVKELNESLNKRLNEAETATEELDSEISVFVGKLLTMKSEQEITEPPTSSALAIEDRTKDGEDQTKPKSNRKSQMEEILTFIESMLNQSMPSKDRGSGGSSKEPLKKGIKGQQVSMPNVQDEIRTATARLHALENNMKDWFDEHMETYFLQCQGWEGRIKNPAFRTSARIRRRDKLAEAELKNITIHAKIEHIATEVEQLQNRLLENQENLKKAESQVHLLKAEHLHAIQEKDEEVKRLTSRLSKIAGAKLTDNNPNITDLSDPNRPTKIAEKFAELYDNQWTDAYALCTSRGNLSEKEAIERLLDLTKVAYKFCKELSAEQMSCVRMLLLFPARTAEELKGEGEENEMTTVHSKILRDIRKELSPLSVRSVQQKFMMTLESSKRFKKTLVESCRTFIDHCVELCWYMAVQSPPVYLDTTDDAGKDLDKNKYRFYTKSGKRIDFVVWPALYLSEDGGVLAKGVAEPVFVHK